MADSYREARIQLFKELLAAAGKGFCTFCKTVFPASELRLLYYEWTKSHCSMQVKYFDGRFAKVHNACPGCYTELLERCAGAKRTERETYSLALPARQTSEGKIEFRQNGIWYPCPLQGIYLSGFTVVEPDPPDDVSQGWDIPPRINFYDKYGETKITIAGVKTEL